MDIKLNTGAPTMTRAWASPARARPANPNAPTAVFGSSTALEIKLANTPEVRADVVARARQLVDDPHYPAPETVRKIANLLASNLDNDIE